MWLPDTSRSGTLPTGSLGRNHVGAKFSKHTGSEWLNYEPASNFTVEINDTAAPESDARVLGLQMLSLAHRVGVLTLDFDDPQRIYSVAR